MCGKVCIRNRRWRREQRRVFVEANVTEQRFLGIRVRRRRRIGSRSIFRPPGKVQLIRQKRDIRKQQRGSRPCVGTDRHAIRKVSCFERLARPGDEATHQGELEMVEHPRVAQRAAVLDQWRLQRSVLTGLDQRQQGSNAECRWMAPAEITCQQQRHDLLRQSLRDLNASRVLGKPAQLALNIRHFPAAFEDRCQTRPAFQCLRIEGRKFLGENLRVPGDFEERGIGGDRLGLPERREPFDQRLGVARGLLKR